MGNYQGAVDKCNVVIGHEKVDSRILFDAYKLKGICSFRLGKVLDSVKCYNFANRLREDKTFATVESADYQAHLRKEERKHLEYTYIKLFIEESKLVFDDPLFQRQVLRSSRSQPQLFGQVLKDLGECKR